MSQSDNGLWLCLAQVQKAQTSSPSHAEPPSRENDWASYIISAGTALANLNHNEVPSSLTLHVTLNQNAIVWLIEYARPKIKLSELSYLSVIDVFQWHFDIWRINEAVVYSRNILWYFNLPPFLLFSLHLCHGFTLRVTRRKSGFSRWILFLFLLKGFFSYSQAVFSPKDIFTVKKLDYFSPVTA